MMNPILLASLPPPGEGVLAPTGQARAPDGWESAFSDVLSNFLCQQDGEKEDSLAGVAVVLPPAQPVSVDTGFPVIETPEGQVVSSAVVETGAQPALAVAEGAMPAFVPPAGTNPTAAAGAQSPVAAVPVTDPAAGAVVEVQVPVEGVSQAGTAPFSEPLSGAGQAATMEAAVTPAPEQTGVVEVQGEPAKPPTLASKAESPQAAQPAVAAAVATAEPAGVEKTAAPAAQRAEIAPPAAEGPVVEPALPVEQADPTNPSMYSSSGSAETQAVNQRSFQAVEGKDQGVLTQMVRTIQTSVQQGQSSLRVQLNPQELGAIDVRLVSNPQGVGVTVFADQASTGRLLEMQIDQLRTSLQEAGVQLTHLNVFQQSQQRQEAPAEWNRKLYNRRQPSFARQDPNPAEAVEGSRLGQSIVDYRV